MCLIIINKLINNSIIMNETISLLMATTILALGGLGLYMFKSSDNENQKGGEEYNESNLFSSNFWGSDSNDNEIIDQNELDDSFLMDENEDNLKKRSKTKSQTKRQKRTSGTKRRY